MKKYGYGHIYLYNPEQKDFYIDEGCNLIDSGVHSITKKTFWVFKYDDVQDAYNKWMSRSRKHKSKY